MDYCITGPDSDVHVIATDGHFCCVGCPKAPAPFKTRAAIYNHLIEHMTAKDKVPQAALTQLLTEHQDKIQAVKARWTPEEARAMLDTLSIYYGEPVKPINEYCKAFYTWQEAMEDALDRTEKDSYEEQAQEKRVNHIKEVSLMVRKSNLLYRLLYEGEQLRTESCPIHNGHWSGCAWGEQRCPHCMSGDDVTGWVAPV